MISCLSPGGLNSYRTEKKVSRLLVGTLRGVRTLERQGDKWQLASAGLGGQHVSSLICEPITGNVFAGMHTGGVFFSADDGETWERRDTGIEQRDVFSLGYGQLDGKPVMYAGTDPAHLYRSLDLGKSWQELTSLQDSESRVNWMFPNPKRKPRVKLIVSDPRDGAIMYVSVEQGALLKSVDAGRSFQEITGYWQEGDPVYKDPHQILFMPSNPDEFYLSTGQGLFVGRDGGKKFTRLTDPSHRIGYPDQVVISPNDEKVVYLAGSAKIPLHWYSSHVADGAVTRSRDGGKTWETLTNGIKSPMHGNVEALTVVSWPDGFALFAGNTDGEVYASEDGGDSWALIADEMMPISKTDHYVPLLGPAA